jgi:nicotinamidase-related amidase
MPWMPVSPSGPASSALVVIDMQKDLCRDLRRAAKVQTMLAPLVQTIGLFVRHGSPVFYMAFALPPGDPQFTRFGDVFCVEGTEGAEIIPELLPLAGPVIYKRHHSAFFETDLHARLQAAGVSTVYLTGLQTQICIQTTAADASFRGYQPVAVRECVVSTKDAVKEDALRWIAKYVGEVMTVDELERRFR